MNPLIKKHTLAALALVFAGTCSLASASTDVSASGAGNQSFDAGVLKDTWTLVHGNILGSYSDSITFTLAGISDFGYSSNTLYVKNRNDFSVFSVQLDGMPLAVTTVNKFYVAGEEFLLAAGLHTLTFSGIGTLAQGGSYQVQMSASPVPEPASYALLLAGLGLLWTLARRRGKVVAV